MTDPVSNEQLYINAMMKKLPDTKEKHEYVIQRGDNLWNLAKRMLNKKQASNKEISDYMLLIAKLNNLDTVEKMNSVKIAQKIYLPDKINSKKQYAAVKIETSTGAYTEAEKSALDVINTLHSDKTARLERAKLTAGRCYHVYNEKLYDSGFYSKNHPVLSFNVDASGSIKQIDFEDSKQNLNIYGYDYSIDTQGNIRGTTYPYPVKGKLSKEQNESLRNELKNMINNY